MRGAPLLFAGLLTSCILIAGCGSKKTPTGPSMITGGAGATLARAAGPAPATAAQTTNGQAGQMPAYYDGRLFTINFLELPRSGEKAVLAHNSGVNVIYQSDPGLPGGRPFISVLDAIQGDGFNPLWEEFQVTFTAGHTPRQLLSDTEVLAAAQSGEITLTDTDELYRCSVVGPKK